MLIPSSPADCRAIPGTTHGHEELFNVRHCLPRDARHSLREPGSVGGLLPACHGPGPDLNLAPTRVIEVYLDGDLVQRQTFRNDRDHQTYEIELPPGRYDVKGPGIPPIPVQVESGQRATVDLPLPQCL
jgi:hypothetical protein